LNIQSQEETSENQFELFAESLKNIFLCLFSSKHLWCLAYTDITVQRHTRETPPTAYYAKKDRQLSPCMDRLLAFAPKYWCITGTFPGPSCFLLYSLPAKILALPTLFNTMLMDRAASKGGISAVHCTETFLPENSRFNN